MPKDLVLDVTAQKLRTFWLLLTPQSLQSVSGLSSLAAGDRRGGGVVVGLGVVRILAITVRVRRRRHDLPELF